MPAIDLEHSFDEYVDFHHPDGQYLFSRIEETLVQEASSAGAKVLDVACGSGHLASLLAERGLETWGIDPSGEMLELTRFVLPSGATMLIRGIAERLPFADASFDSILCQGALDHFADPRTFMREAARVIRPGGRIVIAIANYNSLSCKIGRLLQRGRKQDERPYWQPPNDHHHTGSLRFVRTLGGQGLDAESLQMDRCYGISMLWLLPGWGPLLDRAPKALQQSLLRALDRVAHRFPSQADVIVSVWRARL